MATRRINTQESASLGQGSFHGEPKSDVAPAVPTAVIVKLIGFTLAMIILPIGTYFWTVNTIFIGEASYAGAVAAMVANAVLVAYIVTAFLEDRSERREKQAAERKKQGKKAL